MARTHSSYTASPTRIRSPQRSPARQPSQDGSQYEMDLDALGLNSTFESTELEGNHEPPVDRVDTSEIEGPEDFTMNMTYWMTADLPLAQIKSRKEARTRVSEVRMDAQRDYIAHPVATEENNELLVTQMSSKQERPSDSSASQTKQADGTPDELANSTPASEQSMDNDEKVRSFLSALPDTDMEGALTGTPLHVPRNSFLQVPRSSPPKVRSLQPTVEDHDTPRKPTQETVIHHISADVDAKHHDVAHLKIVELQAQLDQQSLTHRKRITELETILSYTQAELEQLRTDNFRYKEKIIALENGMNVKDKEQQQALASAEARAKRSEDALRSQMQDFRTEMDLQNHAKLHDQRGRFDAKTVELEESKKMALAEAGELRQALCKARLELEQARSENLQKLPQTTREQCTPELLRQDENDIAKTERDSLLQQLSSVQARALELQTSLDKAIADARASKASCSKEEIARRAGEARAATQYKRVAELETKLQTACFELECAQADVAAKEQLFLTNIDLNSRLRLLTTEVEGLKVALLSNKQQLTPDEDTESRLRNLVLELEWAREDLTAKDQQILRAATEHEQLERKFNIAQGRIESFESSIPTLRQQLAEAHREGSRARSDVDRLTRDLSDANESLHNVRAEADHRVDNVVRQFSKTKEMKLEMEKKLREMLSQRDDLVEGHEAMIGDVRDKAEEAMRNARVLLDQERAEKRRTIRDLKKSQEEVQRLQQASADAAEHNQTSHDITSHTSSSETKTTESEATKLSTIIRNQLAEIRTLKAEVTKIKRESQHLRTHLESTVSEQHVTVSLLESQIESLRGENATLQAQLDTQEEDYKAVNTAMDEKLATMLSKVMKERARTVVGQRDSQWSESVGKVQIEKELMGKVLMRQWGREEVGIANENRGEAQNYRYKHIQR